MIKYTHGNILKAQTEALVNTVNCVGVMGKGIALQFKNIFPDNFKLYREACDRKEVQVGKMFVVKRLFGIKYIINFPTKKHWKESSKIEYISEGLKDLKKVILQYKINSIAIPPLGCGLGGLDWLQVKPLIIDELNDLENVEIYIYEPWKQPQKTHGQSNVAPKMTRGKALLIRILEEYLEPGYELTKLEIQKLMYFFQETGERLNLRFEKGHFGPYANNLDKVLKKIEGHFIKGYNDNSKCATITIITDAIEMANRYLEQTEDARDRLEQVRKLIWGFESPYGLELLSTVHWTITHENITGEAEIRNYIRQWSNRKANLFTDYHIAVALKRLKECNMIPT